MTDPTEHEAFSPSTAEESYAERLNRLQNKRWKKILNVQLPWKLRMKRLELGRVLDVGCGNGRNLHYVDPGSVGVDHNAFSIQTARESGVEAYTVDEFFANESVSAPESYDSILAAHLIEHLSPDEGRTIIASYLPMLKRGGRVVFICPQERGYASDPTHVLFADFAVLEQLSNDLGLVVEKKQSFPFPRFMGKPFIYNEFHVIARKP
jgi:2-polyprenyl-3-methyl-5-hydroxy-6-metoxy-1,4-benzoquinol methylase